MRSNNSSLYNSANQTAAKATDERMSAYLILRFKSSLSGVRDNVAKADFPEALTKQPFDVQNLAFESSHSFTFYGRATISENNHPKSEKKFVNLLWVIRTIR